MAVDAVLWLIFAAVIGFVICGCIYTAPEKQLPKLRRDTLHDEADRAA
jgi:hypothetical protein